MFNKFNLLTTYDEMLDAKKSFTEAQKLSAEPENIFTNEDLEPFKNRFRKAQKIFFTSFIIWIALLLLVVYLLVVITLLFLKSSPDLSPLIVAISNPTIIGILITGSITIITTKLTTNSQEKTNTNELEKLRLQLENSTEQKILENKRNAFRDFLAVTSLYTSDNLKETLTPERENEFRIAQAQAQLDATQPGVIVKVINLGNQVKNIKKQYENDSQKDLIEPSEELKKLQNDLERTIKRLVFLFQKDMKLSTNKEEFPNNE